MYGFDELLCLLVSIISLSGRGQLLSNYFSQNSMIPIFLRLGIADDNFGMSNSRGTLSGASLIMSSVRDDTIFRQYIGGTERTTPMEEAAQGVSRALRLIQCRIKATLGKHIDFNEVLSAAYMERQRMTVSSYDMFRNI